MKFKVSIAGVIQPGVNST